MLTTTYSLVTISVEQDNARCSLAALHKNIQCSAFDLSHTNPVVLESAVEQLSRFDQYCHERKVEKYVIPAIRETTSEADPLLAELDSLRSQGMRILRNLRAGLRSAFEQGTANVEELRYAMELYFSNLYRRLIKEDELFEIAQRVISGDQWFAIASCFVSHDRQRRRSKHSLRAAQPLLPSSGPALLSR